MNFIYLDAPIISVTQNHFGFIGGKVNITCTVDAEPPAEINFYFANKNIRDYTTYEVNHGEKAPKLVKDPEYTLYEESNSKLTLEIDLRKEKDFGQYLCTAMNNVSSNKNFTQVKRHAQPNKPLYVIIFS